MEGVCSSKKKIQKKIWHGPSLGLRFFKQKNWKILLKLHQLPLFHHVFQSCLQVGFRAWVLHGLWVVGGELQWQASPVHSCLGADPKPLPLYQVDGGHWFTHPWMPACSCQAVWACMGSRSIAHSHLVYVEIWDQLFVPGFRMSLGRISRPRRVGGNGRWLSWEERRRWRRREERRVKNLNTNIFMDALIKGGRAWGLSGSSSA